MGEVGGTLLKQHLSDVAVGIGKLLHVPAQYPYI